MTSQLTNSVASHVWTNANGAAALPSEWFDALELQPTEPRITRLLGNLTADVDSVFVATLRELGVPIPSGRDEVVLEGTRWRSLRRKYEPSAAVPRNRRIPDLFVTDAGDNYRPLCVIEVKGGAWVNGGWGYCAASPGAYSNQAICYLHDCWNLDPKLSDAPRVWISPWNCGPGVADPFHSRALTPGAVERYPSLRPAYQVQQLGCDYWHFISFDQLLGPPMPQPILGAVQHWLRTKVPGAM